MGQRVWRQLLAKISDIDSQGDDHCLTIDGYRRIKTLCGSMLTLIMVGLIFTYTITNLIKLTVDNNPHVIFNKEYSRSHLTMNLDYNFLSSHFELSNKMIKPAEIHKYLRLESNLVVVSHLENIPAGSQTSIQTTTKRYPFIPVPCNSSTHSQFFSDITRDSSANYKLVVDFTTCFNIDHSKIDGMPANQMYVVKGGQTQMPVHYIEMVYYPCSTSTDAGCLGFMPCTGSCNIHLGVGQLQVDYASRHRPLVSRASHLAKIDLSVPFTTVVEVTHKSVEVYDDLGRFGNKLIIASKKFDIESMFMTFKPYNSELLRVNLYSGRLRDISIRKYYSALRLLSDLGSVIESIVILTLIMHQLLLSRIEAKIIMQNIDDSSIINIQNGRSKLERADIAAIVKYSVFQRYLTIFVTKPYQVAVIKMLVRLKLPKNEQVPAKRSPPYSSNSKPTSKISHLNLNSPKIVISPPKESKKDLAKDQENSNKPSSTPKSKKALFVNTPMARIVRGKSKIKSKMIPKKFNSQSKNKLTSLQAIKQ